MKRWRKRWVGQIAAAMVYAVGFLVASAESDPGYEALNLVGAVIMLAGCILMIRIDDPRSRRKPREEIWWDILAESGRNKNERRITWEEDSKRSI